MANRPQKSARRNEVHQARGELVAPRAREQNRRGTDQLGRPAQRGDQCSSAPRQGSCALDLDRVTFRRSGAHNQLDVEAILPERGRQCVRESGFSCCGWAKKLNDHRSNLAWMRSRAGLVTLSRLWATRTAARYGG